MIKFVPEKENEYITYYVLKPKNGTGILVAAFNAQQAMAKTGTMFKSIVCVKII